MCITLDTWGTKRTSSRSVKSRIHRLRAGRGFGRDDNAVAGKSVVVNGLDMMAEGSGAAPESVRQTNSAVSGRGEGRDFCGVASSVGQVLDRAWDSVPAKASILRRAPSWQSYDQYTEQESDCQR